MNLKLASIEIFDDDTIFDISYNFDETLFSSPVLKFGKEYVLMTIQEIVRCFSSLELVRANAIITRFMKQCGEPNFTLPVYFIYVKGYELYAKKHTLLKVEEDEYMYALNKLSFMILNRYSESNDENDNKMLEKYRLKYEKMLINDSKSAKTIMPYLQAFGDLLVEEYGKDITDFTIEEKILLHKKH